MVQSVIAAATCPGPALAEEQPGVRIEAGGLCEEHRSSDERHERAAAKGVGEGGTCRQACRYRAPLAGLTKKVSATEAAVS